MHPSVVEQSRPDRECRQRRALDGREAAVSFDEGRKTRVTGSSPQQQRRQQYQRDRKEDAEYRRQHAHRLVAQQRPEAAGGAVAAGRFVLGPNPRTALRLILGHQALGLREGCIFNHPYAAQPDIPEPRRGLVIRDRVVVEQRTHLVRLVVGHVAQIEQELGHAGMIATATSQGGLKPALCIPFVNIAAIRRAGLVPALRAYALHRRAHKPKASAP